MPINPEMIPPITPIVVIVELLSAMALYIFGNTKEPSNTTDKIAVIIVITQNVNEDDFCGELLEVVVGVVGY